MSQKGQWYEDFEVPDLVTMVAQNEIFFLMKADKICVIGKVKCFSASQ